MTEEQFENIKFPALYYQEKEIISHFYRVTRDFQEKHTVALRKMLCSRSRNTRPFQVSTLLCNLTTTTTKGK